MSFLFLLASLTVLDETNQAEALIRARDWGQLRILATSRLQSAPKHTAALRLLGLAAAGSGDREEALRCARALASLRSKEALALLRDPLLVPLLFDPAALPILRKEHVRVKACPPLPLAPALHHEDGAAILLEVVVDGDGSVLGVKPFNGSAVLRAAAEDYVVQWTMVPPPDGRPCRFQLWLRFRADGGRQAFQPWEFNPMGGTGRHAHDEGNWSGPSR